MRHLNRIPLCLLIVLVCLPTTAQKTAKKKSKLDLYGDALPEGAIARLGTVRFRHPEKINSIVYTPNGKKLISSCNDYIRIWDAKSGKMLGEISEGSDRISISLDGSKIITSTSKDYSNPVARIGKKGRGFPAKPVLTVWNLDPLKKVWEKRNTTVRFYQHRFLKNGKTVVFGTSDGKIQICDSQTGKVIREVRIGEFGQGSDFVLSDNCSTIAFSNRDNVAVAEFPSGTLLYKIGMEQVVYGKRLIFSPNGKSLYVGGNLRGKQLQMTPFLHEYDTQTGKLLHSFPIPKNRLYVSKLAILNDSKKLLDANSKFLDVWDMSTRNLEQSFSGRGAVNDRSFHTPEEKQLVMRVGAGYPVFLDLEDKSNTMIEKPDRTHIFSLFGPLGKIVATCNYGGLVQIWDAKTGELKRLLFEPKGGGEYTDMVLHSRKPYLAVRGYHRKLGTETQELCLRVWNYKTGEQIYYKDFSNRSSGVVFSKNENKLAYTVRRSQPNKRSDVIVRVIDMATDNYMRDIEVKKSFPKKMSFNSAGTALLTVGSHGEVQAWNLKSRENTYQNQTEKRVREIPFNIIISNDHRFVIKGYEDRIVVSEIHSEKPINVIPLKERVYWSKSFSLSRDDRTIALCTHHDPRLVTLLDLLTGQEVHRLPKLKTKIQTIDFSSDGTKLLTGLRYGTTLVWKIPAREEPASKKLAKTEIAQHWKNLASSDAGVAYRSVLKLSNAGNDIVDSFTKLLSPTEPADSMKVLQLLKQLESNSFATRRKALGELRTYDRLILGDLKKFRDTTKSTEAKRRCEQLIDSANRMVVTSATKLQQLRAIWVLEKIGTPQAKQLLEKLATGSPVARQTREARRGLHNLR